MVPGVEDPEVAHEHENQLQKYFEGEVVSQHLKKVVEFRAASTFFFFVNRFWKQVDDFKAPNEAQMPKDWRAKFQKQRDFAGVESPEEDGAHVDPSVSFGNCYLMMRNVIENMTPDTKRVRGKVSE